MHKLDVSMPLIALIYSSLQNAVNLRPGLTARSKPLSLGGSAASTLHPAMLLITLCLPVRNTGETAAGTSCIGQRTVARHGLSSTADGSEKARVKILTWPSR